MHIIYSSMYRTDFGNWLQDQLEGRGWTQADLARASGLTTAAISRIVNGSRGVGTEAGKAIALAFKIPPETVYRAAGLIPEVPEANAKVEEIKHLIGLLNITDLEDVIDYIRFKAGAPRHQEVPLIYDIFDQLSHEPRRGFLVLVQDPEEIRAAFEPDRYRYVQHAQIPGQGWIFEVIDEEEGKIKR